MQNKTKIKFKFFAIILAILLLDAAVYGAIIGARKIITYYEMRERIISKADEIFCAYSSNGETRFHEFELKAQVLYYNLELGKNYSSDEFETAYFEKNDLFYEYAEFYLKNVSLPNEFMISLEYISYWFGKRPSHLSSEEMDLVMEIYKGEQELVTEYYGDDRIELYKLTDYQQKEFYNLYLDSSYDLDDTVMETDEPHIVDEDY